MTAKQPKAFSRVVFAWFMLVGLIFFFAPAEWTSKFQLLFAHTFNQPLAAGRLFSRYQYSRKPPPNFVHRDRYNRLRNHLANVTEELNQEQQKVKNLSGLRDRPVFKGVNFVLADVITTSVGASHSKLTINRGKSDGLAKGQFVLGNYSIIGTISEVDSRTAQVKLISDPACKIAVKITDEPHLQTYNKKPVQSTTAAIMQGSGYYSARIRLLPTKQPVKIGSVVYVQKKPGFLDTPMITATVTECKRKPENPLLWDITVRPACNIDKLDKVSVVIMNLQKQPGT